MGGLPADTTAQQQPIAAPAQQMDQPIAHPEMTSVPQTIEPVDRVENMPQQPPAYYEATADKSQHPYSHAQQPMQAPQVGQGHMVTPLERLGEEPAWVDCPNCKRITQTRVASEHSTMTVYVISSLSFKSQILTFLPQIVRIPPRMSLYLSGLPALHHALLRGCGPVLFELQQEAHAYAV